MFHFLDAQDDAKQGGKRFFVFSGSMFRFRTMTFAGDIDTFVWSKAEDDAAVLNSKQAHDVLGIKGLGRMTRGLQADLVFLGA
jgi:endonuclease/exonuclease/phosphatase (EEP) superfamily protein YafD